MERVMRGRLYGQVGEQPLPHWRLDLYEGTGTAIAQILEPPRPSLSQPATSHELTMYLASALWPYTKKDPDYVRLLPCETSHTYEFIATYRDPAASRTHVVTFPAPR